MRSHRLTVLQSSDGNFFWSTVGGLNIVSGGVRSLAPMALGRPFRSRLVELVREEVRGAGSS